MSSEEELYKKDIAFASDFVVSASGDLETITGIENVKRALLRRLVTTPGSLVHRPDYGVGIKRWQNAPDSIENKRQIAMAISENFMRDPRVEKVLSVGIQNLGSSRPEMIFINVKVKLVGYGEIETKFVPFGEG